MSGTSGSPKVLVTGGAGFLGSHLCEQLLKEGSYVICLDNFSTGHRSNVAHLMENDRFELVRHDVTLPMHLTVDQIYNLACTASPIHYQRDPIQTAKSSVFGAFHVLELAKRTGARVLQASTSEVYGDPEEHPQSESYWGRVNPIGPRACYDEGKRCAEMFSFDYHRRYGVKIKVARIFNTYGPRMQPDDGRVVSSFIRQALKNQPLTIYGGGGQTRSFCYVDDLIQGLLLLMRSPAEITGPINLGNPVELSVLDLGELIIQLTGSRSGIRRQPAAADDPQRRRPDISEARSKLGWEPTVDLKSGLTRTIQYFEKVLRAGNSHDESGTESLLGERLAPRSAPA